MSLWSKFANVIVTSKSLHYLVAKAFTSVLALISIMVITRLLTPEEYGKYVALLSAYILLSGVFTYWIPVSVFRFHDRLASERFGFRRIYTKAVLPSVLLFLVCLLIIGMMSRPSLGLEGGVAFIILMMLIAATVMVTYNISLQRFISCGESGPYLTVTVVRGVAFVFVSTALLLFHASALALFVAFTTSYLFAVVIARSFLRGLEGDARETADSLGIVDLLSYGLPLTMAYLASQALIYTDRWLLIALEGPGVAGRYSAGLELSMFLMVSAFMALNMTHYPKVIRAYDRGHSLMPQLIVIVPKYLVLAGSIYGLFYLVGDTAIASVLGDDFRKEFVANKFLYLTIGLLQALSLFYFNYTYQLSKRTLEQALLYLVVVAGNVGLGIVLIDWYGIKGAAYSTIAVLLAAIAVTGYRSKGMIGIGLLSIYFPKIMLGVASVIIGSYFGVGYVMVAMALMSILILLEYRKRRGTLILSGREAC